jgi:hypothetical protein
MGESQFRRGNIHYGALQYIFKYFVMRGLLLCIHSHTCCGVLVNKVMVRYFDWPGPPLATSSWVTGKLADGYRGRDCEGEDTDGQGWKAWTKEL